MSCYCGANGAQKSSNSQMWKCLFPFKNLSGGNTELFSTNYIGRKFQKISKYQKWLIIESGSIMPRIRQPARIALLSEQRNQQKRQDRFVKNYCHMLKMYFGNLRLMVGNSNICSQMYILPCP